MELSFVRSFFTMSCRAPQSPSSSPSPPPSWSPLPRLRSSFSEQIAGGSNCDLKLFGGGLDGNVAFVSAPAWLLCMVSPVLRKAVGDIVAGDREYGDEQNMCCVTIEGAEVRSSRGRLQWKRDRVRTLLCGKMVLFELI
jgi:hypothetical protein